MKKLLSLAVAAVLVAPAVHAEVRVSGFGQIVAGKLTGENQAFPDRDYDTDIGFKESLVAVQVDADLGSRATATAQVVSDGYNDFHPQLAWAFVKAKLGGGFSASIGRQRLPLYRYSDFLQVGAAYPWVRPPFAMYNQPWSNFEGVSLSHDAYVGKWYSQAQVIGGRFKGEIDGHDSGVDARLDKLRGASWDMEYDEWLSFRAAYIVGNVTVTGTALDQVTNALNAFGQQTLAARVDYNHDRGTFKSVGAKVDKGNWLAVGEYAKLDVDDTVYAGTNRTDWYATLGYRIGPVMPNFTIGRRDAGRSEQVTAGVPVNSPLYPALYAASVSQSLDESYRTVGVRWDLTPKLALKGDYTRLRSDIPGTKDANLVSTALAFTF
ncbi:hypothetical protein [Lysobacter sp. HA18]